MLLKNFFTLNKLPFFISIKQLGLFALKIFFAPLSKLISWPSTSILIKEISLKLKLSNFFVFILIFLNFLNFWFNKIFFSNVANPSNSNFLYPWGIDPFYIKEIYLVIIGKLKGYKFKTLKNIFH